MLILKPFFHKCKNTIHFEVQQSLLPYFSVIFFVKDPCITVSKPFDAILPLVCHAIKDMIISDCMQLMLADKVPVETKEQKDCS